MFAKPASRIWIVPYLALGVHLPAPRDRRVEKYSLVCSSEQTILFQAFKHKVMKTFVDEQLSHQSIGTPVSLKGTGDKLPVMNT